MKFPRINKGFSTYLTIKQNLIYFTLLSCKTFLNPKNIVGLIKLQGSNEIHMNFGRSAHEFDSNRIPWKIREATIPSGPNLADPNQLVGLHLNLRTGEANTPWSSSGSGLPFWQPAVRFSGEAYARSTPERGDSVWGQRGGQGSLKRVSPLQRTSVEEGSCWSAGGAVEEGG
jgi:hypothetical protein